MGDLTGAALRRFGGGLLVGVAAISQVGDGGRELVRDDGGFELVGAGVSVMFV